MATINVQKCETFAKRPQRAQEERFVSDELAVFSWQIAPHSGQIK
jgi:hypothetical protein